MATILIVDDDAMTLRLVEQTVAGGGHVAIPTNDAVNAARLANERRVDAVILDVVMPGRSGFGVLEDIRKDPAIASLPVLMLSLRSHASDRVKGLRHGADEYVCKPFDPEELLLRLERLLVARMPEESLFRGRLETVSLPEVVQSLLNGGRSGVLEIRTASTRGSIVLSDRRVMSAGFGRLTGADAVLAMLDVDSGTFRFKDQALPEDSLSDGEAVVQLEPVMFSSAWLDDELRRWQAVAVEGELVPVNPEMEEVEVPTGYEALPFDLVWREVVSNPGRLLAELLNLQVAAPRRVRLTVKLLVDSGAVRVVTRSGDSDGEQVGAGDNTNGVMVTVDRLVRTADARGFTGETVPVLLLVEPTVRPALVGFLETLPESVRVPASESSRVILSAGRLAEFHSCDGEVSLAVHVASLASDVVLERVWSGIESYAAVAVWIESTLLSKEVEWIVDRLEHLATPQWGVLMAAEEASATGLSETISRSTRWVFQDRRPNSLMEILDQLASAGIVVALG